MNGSIQRAEYSLTVGGDAEAFRFQHYHHGYEGTVGEGELPIGLHLVFRNDRLHRLGKGTTSHQEPCKAKQPSKRQTFPSSSPLHSPHFIPMRSATRGDAERWGSWSWIQLHGKQSLHTCRAEITAP